MNMYFIAKDQAFLPGAKQVAQLSSYGEVKSIIHHGRISELEELKQDQEAKIIAIAPQVVDWDFDSESLSDIPNVLAVCNQSTSFDWLQPQLLREMGIHLCNCPGFSTDSVAEYIIAMAIEAARALPLHLKNNWEVDVDIKGFQLRGKTIGIVGLGAIGA